MAGNVLKEFLMTLDFKTNEGSLKSFLVTLAAGTVAVKAFDAVINTVVQGVKDMVAAVPALASEMRSLAVASKAAGMSMQELSKLEYVGNVVGVSTDQIRGSMESLSKSAGLAALGMGRAKAMFDELGISVKDAEGNLKKAPQLMNEIRNAVKGMDINQQKAVFERLGMDSAMMKVLAADTKALGGEFDKVFAAAGMDFETLAKDSKQLSENLNKINTLFAWLKKIFASKFIKPVAEAAKEFADILIDNLPTIIKFLTPVFEFLGKVGKAVFAIGKSFLTVVGVILSPIKMIVKGLKMVNDSLGGWPLRILKIIAVLNLLNLTFLASPIGMILGLATAIAMLVQDFQVWQRGGKSFIDWGKWKPAIDLVTVAVKGIGKVFKWVGDYVGRVLGIIIALLTGDFAAAWEGVKEHFQAIGDLAGWLWDQIMGVVGAIGKVVSGIGEFLGITKKEEKKATPAPEGPQQSQAPIYGEEGYGYAPAASGKAPAKRKAKAATTVAAAPVTIPEPPAVTSPAAAPVSAAAAPSSAPQRRSSFNAAEYIAKKRMNPAAYAIGTARITPSPAQAAALGGSTNNVNQKTVINVNESSSPEATARAVGKLQGRVNADLVRNMSPAGA